MKESKIKTENSKRLEVLYKRHHSWLLQVAMNLTHDIEKSEDLVSDVYLYFGEKCNKDLWWGDSFNLKYAYMHIHSRFNNKIKVENRFSTISEEIDIPYEEYDENFDKRLQETYNSVLHTLKEVQKTDMWASAKIAELYYTQAKSTFDSLAEDIGVSRSTIFLHTKKMREYIKENIPNPFTDENKTKGPKGKI
jgi:DNA-directed RNA polymerase specialized sigma24 family protein